MLGLSLRIIRCKNVINRTSKSDNKQWIICVMYLYIISHFWNFFIRRQKGVEMQSGITIKLLLGFFICFVEVRGSCECSSKTATTNTNTTIGNCLTEDFTDSAGAYEGKVNQYQTSLQGPANIR